MIKYTLLVLLGLSIVVSGCKKCDNPTNPNCPNYCQDRTNPDCPNYCQDPTNPDCPNYDRCLVTKPTSAAFQMQEVPRMPQSEDSGFEFYDTDTATFGNIRFIADEPDADSYEWQIGAGTYHTRSVALALDGMRSQIPFNIPARLIIHKTPDTSCFPNDDGIDTVERSLHIVEICETLWEGKYQGFIEGESPTDTFTVSIKHESRIGPDYCADGLRMVNWDKQGCNKIIGTYLTTYRYVNGGGGNSCNYWSGYVWVNPKGDSIQAHYRLSVGRDSDNHPIYEDKVFNGKRIK